jgi:aldehyde dehydrogenase (NAD+)
MATIATQFGIQEALVQLGIKVLNEGTSTGINQFSNGEILESYSPVDGQLIASVRTTSAADYENLMLTATEAFQTFRLIPAPQRGEIVRQFGDKLRKNKEALGKLVSYEMGKSLQEGYGEVQEMIDICDFAVGLSIPPYGDCRNHFGIQLSGGRLGLEHRFGLDLRRCLRLETLRENATLRHCLSKHHYRSNPGK